MIVAMFVIIFLLSSCSNQDDNFNSEISNKSFNIKLFNENPEVILDSLISFFIDINYKITFVDRNTNIIIAKINDMKITDTKAVIYIKNVSIIEKISRNKSKLTTHIYQSQDFSSIDKLYNKTDLKIDTQQVYNDFFNKIENIIQQR